MLQMMMNPEVINQALNMMQNMGPNNPLSSMLGGGGGFGGFSGGGGGN